MTIKQRIQNLYENYTIVMLSDNSFFCYPKENNLLLEFIPYNRYNTIDDGIEIYPMKFYIIDPDTDLITEEIYVQ